VLLSSADKFMKKIFIKIFSANKKAKSTRGFTRLVDFGFVFKIARDCSTKVRKYIIQTFRQNSSKTKILKPKFTTGFTLIEALMAISILMIAIISPMTIAQNGLSSAVYAKEEIVAQFLAQDALEYIKYTRDYNYWNSRDWLFGLGSCKVTPTTVGGCEIDTIQPGAIPNVTPNTSKYFYFSDNNKTYDYSQQPGNTTYKRVITIENPDLDTKQALVTVTVTWAGKNSSENTYTLSTYIYNFYPDII
jgi:type II secretory pathway pseudopilin PulG